MRDEEGQPRTVEDARYLADFEVRKSDMNPGIMRTWNDVRSQLQRLLDALAMPSGDTASMRAAVLEQADRAVLTLGARNERARERRPVRLPSADKPGDIEAVLEDAERLVMSIKPAEPLLEEIELLTPPPQPAVAQRPEPVEMSPAEAAAWLEAERPSAQPPPKAPAAGPPAVSKEWAEHSRRMDSDVAYNIGYRIGAFVESAVKRVFRSGR